MNLTDGTVRAQAGYTYDTAGRVATVGDGGDTLTYAYAPGTGHVASSAWTTATGNNTAYTYDSYHRLTGIAVNNTPVYGYTLNNKDQRTAATLENGDNWAYTYDTLGQLTGALKKDTQDNTLNSMNYAFDLIGNRTSAVEGATNWTYASNLLNQYTQVNALMPTYDADGNMLTWNGWTYTWNGENRLTSATNGNTRVEMGYDFIGRRFEKKVYESNVLTSHEKYVYNGYKQIASYDALSSEALLKTYTWQPVDLDVPVSMTSGGDTYYYVTDGNKNVTALLDASGNRVAEYTYGPFGQTLEANGSLAEENPFRFSSEFHDGELGLVYYNYRHYNPILGRWIKRDPIEEEGGVNLYGVIRNNNANNIDNLGLSPTDLKECMCAFVRAKAIFEQFIAENPYKIMNQIEGFDCHEGSKALVPRLSADELVTNAFDIGLIRQGQFLTKASVHSEIKNRILRVRYVRFVRLHSIVSVNPKGRCIQLYNKMAFDFLLQRIYSLDEFEDMYPLKGISGDAGYYFVHDPPNDSTLVEGQASALDNWTERNISPIAMFNWVFGITYK